MKSNGCGQGRMTVYIGENLDTSSVKRFLEELAIKITGGIISSVSFIPLDVSGRTLEARGSVEKLEEIVDIISHSVFLEDRIYTLGIKAEKAIYYFSFAADYLNKRTGSVGFYKDYFPGYVKIREGVIALDEVMRLFRGIVFDIPGVIEVDGSGKIILLQQEIINRENFAEKKISSKQFQNTEKLIAQEA